MSCVTVADYLKRIRYEGSTEPNLENLKKLAMCHLAWVPFENMDMLQQIPLNLSKEHLWDKIVTRRRGGICHELNNAFAFLLQELGYTLTLHTATVDIPGDEFEHTTLYVEIDGQIWLADVGFGSHVLPPLQLDCDEPQEGYGCLYRLRLEEDGTRTLLCKDEGKDIYERLYDLYPQERKAEDVLSSYLPLAQPGGSMFAEHYVVVRVTPTSKYTIFKEKLTIVENGEKTVVNAPDEATRRAMLLTYFGVSLD